jgi:hypothetical protein
MLQFAKVVVHSCLSWKLQNTGWPTVQNVWSKCFTTLFLNWSHTSIQVYLQVVKLKNFVW